jgi:hypothetical protein
MFEISAKYRVNRRSSGEPLGTNCELEENGIFRPSEKKTLPCDCQLILSMTENSIRGRLLYRSIEYYGRW